jgi:hypothetical protein
MQPVIFLFAVLDKWGTLVTGGVIIAVVSIVERLRLRPIPWRLYFCILALAVFAATYFAWDDQYIRRMNAECQVNRMYGARDQRREFIRRNLTPFYSKAQELFQRRIILNDYDSWQEELIKFENEMENWIKLDMGDLALIKMKDITGQQNKYPHAVNDTHNLNLLALNIISNNLILLIQQPEWDQFTPNAPHDCQ